MAESKLKVSIDGSQAKPAGEEICALLRKMGDESKSADSLLTSMNDTLKSFGSGAASAMSSIISAVQQLGQSATQSINQMSSATTTLQSNIGALSNTATAVFNQMATAITAAVSKITSAISGLGGAAGSVGKILETLIPIDIITKAAEGLFTVIQRFQSFISTMSVVTGSVAGARAELDYLFEIAYKYGLNIDSLTQSYAKFAAAAKNTTLAGEGVRKVFESISMASNVMHLSSEDVRLVFFAIQQMASKGNVSMEELRKQLAERFPGAVQLAAESMGKGNLEFQKMIKNGQVLSQDLLPKMADAINAAFSPASAYAMDSLTAAVNRIHTAWEQFLITMSEHGVIKAAVDLLTGLFDVIQSNQDLAPALGEEFGKMISSIAEFIKGLDKDKIHEFFEAGITLAKALVVVIEGVITAVKFMAQFFQSAQDKWKLLMDDIKNDSDFQKFITIAWNAALHPLDTARVLISTANDAQKQLNESIEAQTELRTKGANEELGWFQRILSGLTVDERLENQRAEAMKGVNEQREKEAANIKGSSQAITDMINRSTEAGQRIGDMMVDAQANNAVALDSAQKQYFVNAQLLGIRTKTLSVTDQLRSMEADRAKLATIAFDTSGEHSEQERISAFAELNNGVKEYIGLRNLATQEQKKAQAESDKENKYVREAVNMYTAAAAAVENYGGDLEDKLTPAMKKLMSLSLTPDFLRLPKAIQDTVNQFLQAADAEQKVKAANDDLAKENAGIITSYLHMQDAMEKTLAADQARIASMQEGEAATSHIKSAEVERFLALDETKKVLDRLNTPENNWGNRIRENLRSTAQLTDTESLRVRGLVAAQQVHDKYINGLVSEADQINKNTDKLKEQALEVGHTKAEIDNLRAAHDLNRLAELDAQVASFEMSETLTKEQTALINLRDALRNNAAAFKELSEAQRAADFKKAWIEAVDAVGQRFDSFVKDVINAGWAKAFKKLWEDFVAWGLAAIAKLALQRVAISIFPQLESAFSGDNTFLGRLPTLLGFNGGTISSGANVVGGLSGVTGGQDVGQFALNQGEGGYQFSIPQQISASSGANLVNTASSGVNLVRSGSNLFSGGFSNFVNGPGVLSPVFGTLPYAPGSIGPLASGGTGLAGLASSAGFEGVGSFLAGVGSPMATIAAAASQGLAAAGGLAALAGAAVPIIGVGLAIASMLGAFSHGGPKGGGSASVGDVSSLSFGAGNGRFYTPTDADPTLLKIDKANQDAYNQSLRLLGGSTVKNQGGFALGFDTDPNGTANNRVTAGATVNGKSVYSYYSGDNALGRDQTVLDDTLKLEAKRSILAALQASDLPEYVHGFINSLDAGTATSDEIDSLLQTAQALKQLVDVMPSFGDVLAKLSPENIKDLTAAFGGVDKFVASTKYVFDNFTTSGKKVEIATQQVNDGFAALGLSVPKTHQEFLDLLQSFDLTTESGRELYASVSALAPVFVQIHGTADDAAASLKKFHDTMMSMAQTLLPPNISNLIGKQDLSAQFQAHGLQMPKSPGEYWNEWINAVNTADTQTQQFLQDALPVWRTFFDDAAAAAAKVQNAQGVFEQNFYTPEEQQAHQQAAAMATVTAASSELSTQLRALGYDSIPTTMSGFRTLIEQIQSSTDPAIHALYEQLILLAPAILTINSAVKTVVNSIDVGTLIGTGKGLAKTLLSQIDSLVNGQNTDALVSNAKLGPFGAKIALRVQLINEQINRLEDQIANAPSYVDTRPMEIATGDLRDSYTKYVNQLAEFTRLSAQYDTGRAQQFIELETWMDDQRAIFGNNAEMMATLNEIFNAKWQDIINGTSTGVTGTIDQLTKLKQGLLDYVQKLKVSDQSPLSPQDKLKEARSQFDTDVNKAYYNQDQDAMGRLQSEADTLLSAGKAMFSIGQGYNDIFNYVSSTLTQVGTHQAPVSVDPMTTVAAAVNSNTAAVKEVSTKLDAVVTATTNASADDTAALNALAAAMFDGFNTWSSVQQQSGRDFVAALQASRR